MIISMNKCKSSFSTRNINNQCLNVCHQEIQRNLVNESAQKYKSGHF